MEKSSFGMPCVTASGSVGVPVAVIVTVTVIGADCSPTVVVAGKAETVSADNRFEQKRNENRSATHAGAQLSLALKK